jgi:nucleoside-diphosphate-sugar epimerase
MSGHQLVVIAGGTGFVGGALITALRRAGYRTMIVSRARSQSPHTISWVG